jgi:hypothetical protein
MAYAAYTDSEECMFNYDCADSVRAALYAEGIRVTKINGSVGCDFLFYGSGYNICTSDSDCRDKIDQLSDLLNFLIVTYIRIG